ncbi:Arylamine N-acetyltransferase 2 [Penicillium digitatum PHI26]|uniref:Arylamine N-acetyltransferase 2 n=2 Tax=Penicillium digitatum TaxID=36651 RepID=K9F5T6_PEND2|nr:Arylamine N-acetyltransferase 2 [Penicillium digitatum Pd1]EKV04730.1 Arylamine N-acetyltransferase 2 [Penicillium digitatum PHI26]EKV17125.1 Arylamine N-acetyltransferase 2 [Penicillium digitatum Pd1]
MAQNPIYTDQQLEWYLSRIGYSHPAQVEGNLLHHLRQDIENDALAALCDLQRRHLTTIPWGNSGLHYSQHHTISLNPQSLFEKMVERQLDGYCMENSGIFLIVLRSLGYLVGHMVLIVIIGEEKYMVDVGFGNNCATAPLLLQEGATATAIEPSEMRIVRESIAEFTDPRQKVWVYQTRYNSESKWLPQICFSDVEFLPQDFGIMNFSVSQSRTSWFTQTFVCMRMIMDQTGTEIIGQCVVSGKEVKERLRGQTAILQVLETEEDRIQALAKYFDMHLRETEIQGIRGMTSELK